MVHYSLFPEFFDTNSGAASLSWLVVVASLDILKRIFAKVDDGGALMEYMAEFPSRKAVSLLRTGIGRWALGPGLK